MSEGSVSGPFAEETIEATLFDPRLLVHVLADIDIQPMVWLYEETFAIIWAQDMADRSVHLVREQGDDTINRMLMFIQAADISTD